MAAFIAYVYSSLRDSGAYPIIPLPNPLVIPETVLRWFGVRVDLPDIPAFIGGGGPRSVLASIGIALLTAFGLGVILHYLVFRPLRYAPVLAKIVASLGVMLVLQSAIVLRFGSRARVPHEILPTQLIQVLGVAMPVDRLLLLGLVLMVATAFWLLFKFTRFGLATRAAAENERAVTFLGFSADYQAGVSWILATVTAGLVGILVAPITGLVPNRFSLLVVPALGAALLARLSSFGLAAAFGLAIGMVQSEILLMETRLPWFPDFNLQEAFPFIVIVIAMLLIGRSLPSRAALVESRLPAAPAPRIRPWLMIGLAAATLGGILFLPPQYRDALNNTMIGVSYALSLVVITGYVGQISFVQGALAGVAAFGVATFYGEGGLAMPLAVAGAITATVLVGLLVAIPAVRTRGASLAIATLASAVAIQELLFRREGWFGARGAKPVDAPNFLGLDFGPSSPFLFGDGKLPSPGLGVFIFVITLVLIIAVMRLRRSSLGRRMLAVRGNERAAASAGINVEATKLIAFGIAALIAGVAGVMSAYKIGTVDARSFSVFPSLAIFALAYLGGISTVGGAIWTGIIFTQGVATLMSEQVVALGRYTSYVAGVFVIANAVLYSEGIDGANRQMADWVVAKWKGRQRARGVPGEDTVA